MNSSKVYADTNMFYGPASFNMAFKFIMSCICLVSIVLDLIILVTVSIHRVLWTKQWAFMCSLAISDLAHVIAGMGIAMATRNDSSPQMRTKIEVRALRFCFMFSNVCAYLSFLSISGERWLYIAKPFLYQRLVTKRNVGLSIALIWILSMLTNCTQFVFDREVIDGVFFLPILHGVSSILIFLIYADIIVITRRQVRCIANSYPRSPVPEPTISSSTQPDTAETEERRQSTVSQRSHWKAVKMMLMVFGLFVLTLSPYVYTNMAALITHNEDVEEVTWWFLLLGAVHYFGNFFVYVSYNRGFRDALHDSIKFSLQCFKRRL